jgi:hypothetical protein
LRPLKRSNQRALLTKDGTFGSGSTAFRLSDFSLWPEWSWWIEEWHVGVDA